MTKDAFVQLKDIKYRTQAYELQGSEYMTWNMHRLWSPFGAYDGREKSGGMKEIGSISVLVSLVFIFVL
jgi:hypothetical protein